MVLGARARARASSRNETGDVPLDSSLASPNSHDRAGTRVPDLLGLGTSLCLYCHTQVRVWYPESGYQSVIHVNAFECASSGADVSFIGLEHKRSPPFFAIGLR
jgi:hypothetical protein